VPRPAARDAGGSAAAASDAGPASGLYLHAASRCGDCHDKMFGEWQASAHARSARSFAFAAMRAAAPDAAGCDVCHRPLARYAAPTSVSDDGVTCDVCHTLRAVAAGAPSPRFELEVTQPVKYGPFCQLDDHYFHRMGCSPLHRKSQLCSACHQLEIQPPGGGAAVPVYTTWSEWQATGYARDGVECQDCHMPATRAAIAEGAAVTRRVGDHRLATTGRSAYALEARGRIAPEQGDAIVVMVEVSNRGAGHYLPTGSPDRRLVLRVLALDPGGRELERAETSFGRGLLDAAGNPAPRGRAVRAGEDTRIPPGGSSRRELTLRAAAPEGRVRVELARRALDPAIAGALGVQPPADQVVLTAELPYRAAHRAGDLARRVRGRP